MGTIKAFKGFSYNQEHVFDLSSAICPPYDVISSQERSFYYKQSPYNFVHLILNNPQEQDNGSYNQYTRARLLFNEWRKADILKQDNSDCLYFYKQDFIYRDKELSRLGFIGLMGLGSSDTVFPHENTHQAPKTDRLELLKNVKANLTPIFTVFSDKKMLIEEIFKSNFSNKKPAIAVKDYNGVRHSLWKLSEPELTKRISKEIGGKKILIADGHHRFEVARMYLESMKQEDISYSPDKSYNFIMAYFAPLESKGLCIMPIHRVIKAPVDLELIRMHFKINEFSSISELENALERSNKKKYIFGFYQKGRSLLLEAKNKKEASANVRLPFRDLDVAILDSCMLEKILNVDKKYVGYANTIQDAKELADGKEESNSVFIMRPTSINQVKEVALGGERMPPKSTFFYPKLASGLVLHKFED